MMPLKNLGAVPIFNHAILSSTLKKGSSAQFTTTSVKVNNNTTNTDDPRSIPVTRSRSCVALPSKHRAPSLSPVASVRNISTSGVTRDAGSNFLSQIRTARNSVDMAMFQLNGVSEYLIKPGIQKRRDDLPGTIGQILGPKTEDVDLFSLDPRLDHKMHVKNLGYALKCESLDSEPQIPDYMYKNCSLPTFSNLSNGQSLPSVFRDSSSAEVEEELSLSREIQAEVKEMVSDAVVSAKQSYVEKWGDTEPSSESELKFDRLGSLMASNLSHGDSPVLNVDWNPVECLPMIKDEALGLPSGGGAVNPDGKFDSQLLVAVDSLNFKSYVEELAVEPSETLPHEHSKTLPEEPSVTLLNDPSETLAHDPSETLAHDPSETLPRDPSETLPHDPIEFILPCQSQEMIAPQIEDTPSIRVENSATDKWEDAIVGFSPAEALWKTVSVKSHATSEELAGVKMTKVKPRPIEILSEKEPKSPIHHTEVPLDEMPSTHPNSILHIIDSPNRAGVFIKTDLYTTNHILDELKKDNEPSNDKNPSAPKAEAISFYEDDSHVLERSEEYLSHEGNYAVPFGEPSDQSGPGLFSGAFPKPPASSNCRSMSFSKKTTSPSAKPPNVDVNVETIIKYFKDRTHSHLTVSESQKYVDVRLPYPFCTESNLHITGTNEALNQGINAVETAKSKLVIFGKPNETSTTIRGNVHLNHMLSDIKESNNATGHSKNKKPLLKVVPIQTINPDKPPSDTALSPNNLKSKIKQVLEANPPERLTGERQDQSAFPEIPIQVLTSRMMQKMFGGDGPKVKSKSKFIIKPKTFSSSPVPYKTTPKKAKINDRIVSEKWKVRGDEKDVIELCSDSKKKCVNLNDSNRVSDKISKEAETEVGLNALDRLIIRKIVRQRLQRAMQNLKFKPDAVAKEGKQEGRKTGKWLSPSETTKGPGKATSIPPEKSAVPLKDHRPSSVTVPADLARNSSSSPRDSKLNKPGKSPGKMSPPLSESNAIPRSLKLERQCKDNDSANITAVKKQEASEIKTEQSTEADVVEPESEIIIIKNDNPAAKSPPKPSNREIIYIINDANKVEQSEDSSKAPVDPKKPVKDPSESNNLPSSCSESKISSFIVTSKKYKPKLNQGPVIKRPSLTLSKPEVKAKDTILEKSKEGKDKQKSLIDIMKETSIGQTTIGRVSDLGSLVPKVTTNKKQKSKPDPSRPEMEPNKNFIPLGMFMGAPRDQFRFKSPSISLSAESSPKPGEPAKNSVSKEHSALKRPSIDFIQGPVTLPSASVPLQKIIEFPLMNAAKSLNLDREVERQILSIKVHKDPELRIKLAAVPSVTKILNATMSEKSKSALLRWRKNLVAELGEEGFLKYYAEQLQKGTDFHSAVQEILIKRQETGEDRPVGDLIDSTNLPLQSIVEVLKDVKSVRVLESHVVHPKLNYRGVIDCVAKYREKPVLIEWKRSDKPKPTVKHTYDAPIQLSAYIGAINFDDNYKIPVSGGLVVVAYSDGSPADTYEISLKECNKYWKKWLERLKNFLDSKPEIEDK